jgi:hypothetical protein
MDDKARDDTEPSDRKMYTGETLDTPEGPKTPQQMNVGVDNEEGGGEWPDPDTPPQAPAPGSAEGDDAGATEKMQP